MDNASTSALTPSRLRRVAGMGLMEIGYRGRQAGSKWIDRIRDDGGAPEPCSVLRRHARSLADPAAAQHVLLHEFPQRFFAGATREGLTELLCCFPEHCADVMRAANTLLDRRFDLLGYRGLSFGDPIDWHLDPVWSRQAPIVHWSRIDVLNPAQVGDSKVIWELNRHQWVVRLAQAYALSGEPRYANAAVRAIAEWIAANPHGRGINWASSLEVSMRVMSWTWALALLRGANAVSGGTLVTILASIHAQATHVLKYLSVYYSPNTHLTGEALGLFYAGTLFPEFNDASKWQDVGARTLVEQAERQITADGVYFEQSTCYQRYTCEIYLHFLLLAERNGVRVPDRISDRVTQMVEALAALQNPDGSMPAIGDADGGWLMPLAQRAPSDFQAVFALAAAMFGRAEFAAAAGSAAPETVWLMGAHGAERFGAAKKARPAPATSRIFTDGGYALMRVGAGGEAHQLVMDIGPLGCPVSSGHGHADLLSIQCSIFGEPCLVDAGTYGYSAESEWRDYFRGTAAHSTVLVDGRSQAEPTGPFRWNSRPLTTVLDWRTSAQFDLVDAQQDAYPGVSHRRRVLFVKPDFWMVVDDLLGDGEHAIDLTFQFAPLDVTLEGDLIARAQTARGRALWIAPVSTAPVTAVINFGQTDPIRGWVSPDYGQRVAAPALVYHAAGPLPIRIVTVLYPDRRPTQPPTFEPLVDASGLPAGVRVLPANIAAQLDGPRVVINRG